MKKRITIISMVLILAMILVLPVIATGCTDRSEILKVYTWSEYLDDGMEEAFEKYYTSVTGKKVKVKLDLFDENELMYAQINTSKADYDVICPSDYMIEKMIKDGLLLKLEDINEYGYENLEDYRDGMSELVMSGENSLFKYDYDAESGEYNLYSRTYMWGTMGISYAKDSTAYKNSSYGTYSSMQEYVEDNGWAIFLDSAMKDKFKLKNSMRDTYVCASIYTLLNEKSKYYDPTVTVSGALNATDSASVNKIKEIMLAQKALTAGYENDEGKENVLASDIDFLLQWAGDGLYSMTSLQEETGLERELGYFVPKEGSNIFCDGWCIPKYAKNIEAANLWINFMCRPDIAVRNMDYICYSSGVASKEAFDYLVDNWGSTEPDAIPVDLSYFFGTDRDFDTTLMVAPEDYEGLIALFPTQDIIARCAVMLDFGDATDAMNTLWRTVRAGS